MSRARTAEVSRFAITGGLAWLVDVGAFNLFRLLLPPNLVILAKLGAVVLASLFSWTLNRNWAFAGKGSSGRARELAEFMTVNAAGFLPPLLCLWVSHYLLGLTSALADNISANIIGVILGTVLRYLGYRHIVFRGGRNN